MKQKISKNQISILTLLFVCVILLPMEVLAVENAVHKKTETVNTISNLINDVVALLPIEISNLIAKEYSCVNVASQFNVSDKYWITNRIDKKTFYTKISKIKIINDKISCDDISNLIKDVIEISNAPTYYDPLGDKLKSNLNKFVKYQIQNKLIIKYDGYDKSSINNSLDQLFLLGKYKVEDKYPRLILITANLFCYIWDNNGKFMSDDKIALLREPLNVEFNNTANRNQISGTNVTSAAKYKASQKTNNNYAYGRERTSYQRIGNITYGSNGTSYQRIGNITYGSDGTSYQHIGNITYGSNGTSYQRIGNITYGSDGTSYQRIGNITFGSDGTSCQKIGSFAYCN